MRYITHSYSLANTSDEDLVRYGSLLFYKHHHKSFPNLTKLAKIVLSVTATSVPSESLFSKAGITSNNLRNRLNPNLLEKLVFIKSYVIFVLFSS